MIFLGYPNRPAAHVALGTVRKWMETEKNHELVSLFSTVSKQ